MPNLPNAKKALRQTVKRTRRNKLHFAEIRSLRVKVRKALTAGKIEEAEKLIKEVGKKIDKAVNKSVLKKNTAARIKSRMMMRLNALKAK